ncbi:unnamed protein product [Phytophthora fragariaefolia]|uniref:Unnamed protein product n=1 Tax=Phytophthora fragariaefolia TaxID=1490495 RepID=A0A9W6XKV6_9STRA|nr:unnamed protein product [Phytophthora fragariaefolia]
MTKYVSTIATSGVPLNTKKCPACEADTIESIPLEKSAFQKPPMRATRPITTVCQTCKADFGGSELIIKTAEQVAKGPDATDLSDEAIFRRIASPKPLPKCLIMSRLKL